MYPAVRLLTVADGWVACEGGVSPSVVVVVEEVVWQSGSTFVVAGEDLSPTPIPSAG
jgi:hypothetical protein